MQIGEAWLCDVQSKGGSTFFAAPIQKLDASFFMDLVPAQKDLLVRVALENHRDLMAPYVHQVLAANKDGLADERLSGLMKEKEQLEARLHDLEEQYDEAEERLRRAELEVRTLRAQPDHGNGSTRALPPSAPAGPPAAPPTFVPLAGVFGEPGPVHVVRTHEDVLESMSFDAERYFGHVSPDRRRVFLKPHHNGNLPCVNGRVQIPGLNRIMAFDPERNDLAAYYDPRHGGFFVKLA